MRADWLKNLVDAVLAGRKWPDGCRRARGIRGSEAYEAYVMDREGFVIVVRRVTDGVHVEIGSLHVGIRWKPDDPPSRLRS